MSAGPSAAHPPGERPARGTRHAIGGGVWTLGERIVSQLSQLAVFIVAARLLGPAEFGVFALVSAVSVILLRVAELGWPSFIMNWSGDETVPRQVLSLSIISGAAVGLMAIAATGLLSLTPISRDVVALSALFSLWVALGPLAGALHGLMVWRGHLITASLCETAGELAALAVSVAALMAGHGILALAYGRLAYIALRLALSVLATRAMPAGRLREAPLGEIRDFSVSILATRLIFHLRGYVGTFMIGGFLGPAAVGHYRAAERLTGAAAEILGVPVEKLAWSYLRGARDDPEGGIGSPLWNRRARIYFRAVKIVSVPAFVWVALMADDIVVGLLGPEWRPAAIAASLLAISRILLLYGHVTEPVLALAGEVRRMPGAMMVFLAAAVALTLASAPFGLVPVSAAQIALGGIVLVVTLRLFERHAALPTHITLAGTTATLGASAGAALAAVLLERAGFGAQWQPLVKAMAVGLAALPVYAALILALDAPTRALARRLAGRAA